METYKSFTPTGFDNHIEVDNRENWLVVPVGRNRDSGCLDESNFKIALLDLGDESDTVEVHRFGHWANGWFEILIVKPDSPEAEIALEIESTLADYPVLSDEHLGILETEAFEESWNNYGHKEFCEQLVRELGLSDEASYALDEHETDYTQRIFQDNGGEYFFDSGGCNMEYREVAWLAFADELLKDYTKTLLSNLRHKAWIGAIDRFAPEMEVFWNNARSPDICKLEAVLS